MSTAPPFAVINQPADEAALWAVRVMENAGLQVIRTFDLQEARLSHPDCPCPHHGTEACNCQMSVLLVYQEGQSPASILIHSFQETTCLYLIDTPEQPVDQDLDLLIREVLTQPVPSPVENSE